MVPLSENVLCLVVLTKTRRCHEVRSTNISPTSFSSIDEIPLRVDDDSILPRKTLFQEWIPGRKRNAVIAALDHKVNGREDVLEFSQSSAMVTQEVRLRGPPDGRKTRSRNEGGHFWLNFRSSSAMVFWTRIGL